MTVTYGFYNSLSGDRVYDAEDFGSIFDGIIADGIFQSQGGGFGVTQDTGSNMNVLVATGRAWLNGTWTFNDAILALTVGNADPVLNRIDTVVIEVDASSAVRANSIKIIAGTAASTPVAPTLTDSGTLHQHPLADIYVGAGVTAITNANITNRIGTDTPFCTGILETLSVAWLFANWEEQFQDWFDNLVDQLTGTQVTNLQNQIDAIGDHWPSWKNLLINGSMKVAQRSTGVTGLTTSGYYVLDRWYLNLGTAGTFSMWATTGNSDLNTTGQKMSAQLICTTASPSLSAPSNAIFVQRIMGRNLQHLRKGTASAKDLTISFWVRSNHTGAYVVELYDVDNSRSISRSYNINTANTWEFKEINIPGDTTGALDFDNANSLQIGFWLAAGSNFSSGTLQTSWGTAVSANRAVGQTNFVGSASNNIHFTGIQMEVRATASDFEDLSFEDELMRCLPYYQKSFNYSQAPVTNLGVNTGESSGNVIAASSPCRAQMFFQVPMRATPTMTGYNPAAANNNARDVSAGIDFAGTFNVNTKGGYWWGTAPGGSSPSNRIGWHWTADAEL